MEERENCHPLLHFPIAQNCQSEAKPNPGARNFFWVAHIGAEAQAILTAFLKPLEES